MADIKVAKGSIYECPFCQKPVILCGDNCTVYHDNPPCPEFTDRMNKLGLSAREEPFTIVATPINSEIVH